MLKGQGFALNKQKLASNLQQDGMLVTAINEASATAEHRREKLHRKAKPGDLILFAKEFAVLLENGIPIIDALEVLTKQMSSIELANAAKAIKKDIEGGAAFSRAIAKNPRVFSEFWQYLAEAGELSGQLPFVFKQIVSYLESQDTIRKKTVNAMIYPALLAMVAVSALLIFTLKIVPVFKQVFASLGANRQLPALTQVMVAISDTLRHNLAFVLVGIAVIIIIFRQIMSAKGGKRIVEKILLKTPVLGDLYLALAMERFASTIKTLLKSGIPIIKAIEMSQG